MRLWKIHCLTFSRTLRDYSVSNRSFGKGLCFVYAIVIAVGSSEDIADFNHFPWRKQRQNHLPLSRSSTTLFSQKEEGNVNETEYSTHTLSHLNANISLIISQTKKCFGLKNCLALSFFVSYSFLLIRTNVHFAFVFFFLRAASLPPVYNYFRKMLIFACRNARSTSFFADFHFLLDTERVKTTAAFVSRLHIRTSDSETVADSVAVSW